MPAYAIAVLITQVCLRCDCAVEVAGPRSSGSSEAGCLRAGGALRRPLRCRDGGSSSLDLRVGLACGIQTWCRRMGFVSVVAGSRKPLEVACGRTNSHIMTRGFNRGQRRAVPMRTRNLLHNITSATPVTTPAEPAAKSTRSEWRPGIPRWASSSTPAYVISKAAIWT
jgi:hypothetical protein